MKHIKNISLLTIMSVILLSSCIDKDYNWDNLDKTGAINIGNIPIGDAEKLTVKSLLPDNLQEDLKVGNDGVFYLEYIGDINVNDPVIEVPDTDPVSIETITLPIPETIIPLPENETFKVVENDLVSYTISEPYFNDTDWEIMVTSVDFESCAFIADISFSGLSFSDVGYARIRVEVDIEFPHNIVLKGQDSRTVKRTFGLEDLNNGKITLPAIPLASIDYSDGVQDLVYSVTIFGAYGAYLIANSGTFDFDLTFRTQDVEPYLIYGSASFNRIVEDRIADLQELDNSFGPNDVMKFDDIQFYLDLTTNLGADFIVGVDRLTTGNATEEVSINNVAANNLTVLKPELDKERTTSYVLSKKNPGTGVTHIQADMTPLFGIIPSWLDYKISLHNDGITNKNAFFPYNRLKIDAGYRIVLPFNFSEIDLHLADTLTNVFKDDLAEDIFFKAGQFKVMADEAIVHFANAEADALNLIMQVSILDENMNKIDVEVIPVYLTNGTQPLEITINIKEQDISKLQKAMHLSFDFDITNHPGKVLSLSETDSIEIKGIKFQTTSGIKFDLE